MAGPLRLALAAVLLAVSGAAQAANRRIFSYDPADAATRHTAGGLTFEFNQHLLSTTVLRVRATEGQATAELRHASDGVVGRAGLSALIGSAPQRDLYQVLPGEDGAAMIAAFCPGAKHAWMAFDRLKANRDMRVLVFGDGPDGKVRRCQTLAFSYHGEWRLPPGPPPDERLLAPAPTRPR